VAARTRRDPEGRRRLSGTDTATLFENWRRPLGGRSRDVLYPGLRTVPFERAAVIAYLVRDGWIEVTNVFYGGRDYEALYREEER